MPLVAYTRVSTGKQQASGLGLEAQQEAIEQYARRTGEPILATFTEVESGAVRDRPELAAALDLCRRKKAVLLIARLDRLSRSLAFVAQLLDANVEIRAADMPEANRMMIQMLAVFAEHERRLIGERTRQALAAAKARGVQLGANGAVLAERHRAEASA
jgi:DNA invertase Pin-like site-specific DNA recombinase